MESQGVIASAQMALQVEEIDINKHQKMPYFFVSVILSVVRKVFIICIHGLQDAAKCLKILERWRSFLEWKRHGT